jgi:microcystin-dependent protein
MNILVLILLLVLCFGIGIYPNWRNNLTVYMGIIIVFMIIIYSIVFYKIEIVEHLQISSEAVQNVGSIYNQEKMIVKNLDVTGALNILPRGVIVAWKGQYQAPVGWALCDGNNGTPDLRGRFIFGAGHDSLDSKGGEREHTLNESEMPSHKHGMSSSADDDGYCKQINCGVQLSDRFTDDNGKYINDITTGSLTQILPRGGDKAHNNMPPYYVLTYIMKL